jgi:hypothetical protein
MNTKQTLQTLLSYYTATRKIGHTRAMLAGAQNTDGCLILTGVDDIALTPPKGASCVNVVYDDNLVQHFVGVRKPMLVDNSAIEHILRTSLAEITRLETHVKRLKTEKAHLAQGRPGQIPAEAPAAPGELPA